MKLVHKGNNKSLVVLCHYQSIYLSPLYDEIVVYCKDLTWAIELLVNSIAYISCIVVCQNYIAHLIEVHLCECWIGLVPVRAKHVSLEHL